MKEKLNRFPPGWDEERVGRVVSHYTHQTPEEAVAEDEARFDAKAATVMIVPKPLVPLVRELIAQHMKQRETATGRKQAKPRKIKAQARTLSVR